MKIDLQKASLLKRASAFLFDLIIFSIVCVAIAVALSAVVGYDSKLNDLQSVYLKYEEEYGIDLELSEDGYAKLSPEEKERYEQASDAFSKDESVIRINSEVLGLTFLIITLSVFISFVLLEFVIPLVMKNGQTLGKKIFSLAVIRTDFVKVSPLQMFVRSILGKYTIETMFPVMLLMLVFTNMIGLVGFAVILMLIILQIIVIAATYTNSMIHDLLSVTVVVDINTQRMFESPEQLIEYKKEKAAEASQLKPY